MRGPLTGAPKKSLDECSGCRLLVSASCCYLCCCAYCCLLFAVGCWCHIIVVMYAIMWLLVSCLLLAASVSIGASGSLRIESVGVSAIGVKSSMLP